MDDDEQQQNIDNAVVAAILTNSTDATLSKRQDAVPPECSTQKKFSYATPAYGIQPTSVQEFQSTFAGSPGGTTSYSSSSFTLYTDSAGNAFKNLQKAAGGSGYMGLQYLSNYSPEQCGTLCLKTNGCNAFNLYLERDPQVSANYETCLNPPSIVVVKCVLYNTPFAGPVNQVATNGGQFRSKFQIVIAASTGYNLNTVPPKEPGYGPPQALNGAIKSNHGYIRVVYADTQSAGISPDFCAQACDAQRNYAIATNDPTQCVAFNYFLLSKNGGAGGTQIQCSLYSDAQDPKDATNTGDTRGTDTYTVKNSLLYNPA